MKNRIFPMSFYFLTDGIFNDMVPDLTKPLASLIGDLMAHQTITSSFLSVTIIQFGEDPRGSRALYQIRESTTGLTVLPVL